MNEDCLYKKVCTTPCTSGCIRYKEMKFLIERSQIPKNRCVPTKLYPSDCDFDAFSDLAKIRNDIVNFVDEGSNLYIFSDYFGNGKTTWAIKLMLTYFSNIWNGNGFKVRGLFINVPTFLTKCKAVISNPDKDFDRLRELIPKVDLIIWDDIASQNLTDFDYNNLLSFIDERVLSRFSNIYTGNLNQAKLNTALGNRLGSRVWNSASNIVELKGEDMR